MSTATRTTPTCVPAESTPGPRMADYLSLAKPRIVTLVLVMTMFGALMGARQPLNATLLLALLHALIGTALAAAGTNALNQFAEREYDARMERTRRRPLPAGRLAPRRALAFGLILGAAGPLYLALQVNLIAALLAAATLLSYLLLYTPLKRVTHWSLLVGAVPGALPPLIGWAAVTGRVEPRAWLLFAIMFFWQLPHFLAIAWRHRDDYARAGFATLSVVDPDGRRSARHIVVWSVVLLAASVLPAKLGLAGPAYLAAALILGLAFLAVGLAVARARTSVVARWHLLASLLYLPALFAVMLGDKL